MPEVDADVQRRIQSRAGLNLCHHLQLAIRLRPWARNRQTRPAHDRKVFDCVASGRVSNQRIRFGTGRRECLEARECTAGHSVNEDSMKAARSISVWISIDA